MDWTWDYFKTFLYSAFEEILLTLLIGLLLLFVYLSIYGAYDPGIPVALATIALAALTYVNVRNSSSVIREMRKDREKPGIVLLIAKHLDPQIDGVAKRKFEVDLQDDFPPLPSLVTLGLIRDTRIEYEIQEYYSEYQNDLNRYGQIYDSYNALMERLTENLDSYLKSEFVNDIPETKIDEIERSIDEHDLENKFDELYEAQGPIVEAYFEEKTTEFLVYIIRGESELHKPADIEIAELIHSELMALRNEKFGQEFEELESYLNSMSTILGKIEDGLESAREDFKDDYGIIESEIKEKSERAEDQAFV